MCHMCSEIRRSYIHSNLSWDGILGHQFNKRLGSFAPIHSPLVPEDFFKKSTNQENSSLFTKSILFDGKMRVKKSDKTWAWEDSSFCPGTSTKNAVQEFHLCGGTVVLIKLYEQIFVFTSGFKSWKWGNKRRKIRTGSRYHYLALFAYQLTEKAWMWGDVSIC